MGKIVLKSRIETMKIKGEEVDKTIMDNKDFNRFNSKVLGLGDIRQPSKRVEAVAAVFDLSGFTDFCSQIDPHLAVPEYLSRFLDWLFDKMRKEHVEGNLRERKAKVLWAKLPFLAKFLGDGVLFLWDTEKMSGTEICNIVVTLSDICDDYEGIFCPQIRKIVAEPPKTLRCGIARGTVCSVGNGEDYVGPCINVASRLQKLSLLTFCVSRKGFDFQENMNPSVYPDYKVKSVQLRGIGDSELVWVLRKEFNGLPPEEKQLFEAP